jgi:cell division initiation protein
MRITPLDVRKQEFRRSVRGFDCEEVRAFLTTVADEYEAVLVDNKQLRERILEQDQKLVEYRELERTLRDTLMTAERMMQEAKTSANKEGDVIIREAGVTAQQVLDRARQRAEEMRRELIALHKEKAAYLARFRSLAEAQVQFVENHMRDFEDIDTRLLDEADAQVRRAVQPIGTDAETPEILHDYRRDDRIGRDDPAGRGDGGQRSSALGGEPRGREEPDPGLGTPAEPTSRPAPTPEVDIWRDYAPGNIYASPRIPPGVSTPNPARPGIDAPETQAPDGDRRDAEPGTPRAVAAGDGTLAQIDVPPVAAHPGVDAASAPRPYEAPEEAHQGRAD